MTHQSKQVTDRARDLLLQYQVELQKIQAELAFCEVGHQELSRSIGHLILISQGTIALLKASTATNDEPNPF